MYIDIFEVQYISISILISHLQHKSIFEIRLGTSLTFFPLRIITIPTLVIKIIMS